MNNPAPPEFPLRELPTPYIYARAARAARAAPLEAASMDASIDASLDASLDASMDAVAGAAVAGATAALPLRKRKRSVDARRPALQQQSEASPRPENSASVLMDLATPSADSDARSVDAESVSADVKRARVLAQRDAADAQSIHMHGETSTNASVDTDMDVDVDVGSALSEGVVAPSSAEDALPISPVASADGRAPLVRQDATGVLDTISAFTAGPVVPTVPSGVSPLELQRLAYSYIARLNRAQLTDLGSLIRDNLKRDLVASVPTEIALNVLARLAFRDIVACLAVSRGWHALIENSPAVWKHLLLAESLVPAGTFPQYAAALPREHPELPAGDEAYKPDFLRRMRTLHHWYDPQFAPQRTTLRGHMTSVVTCLQFADDYVITGADDKMIRVYNARTKRFQAQLAGHEGGVWALKYDCDGILVSGSTDRSVRVWDVRRGVCLYVFKGHTSTVRCLDIVSYKGTKYIVTGSRDNTLHVWKLCPSLYNRSSSADGTGDDNDDSLRSPVVYDSPDVNPYFVGVLKGHVASVRTVSGHGNIVISGSYDNTLIVWDIAQMKCLYILTGHSDRIYSVIYDHARGRCISASMDSTVRVWDLVHLARNGSQQTVTCAGTTCTRVADSFRVLSGHSALVGLLKLSDKYLVSAAADGTLKGWDAEDYTLRFSYLHSNMGAITTFHMTDNLLVSGSERQFNVYNLRSGALVHSKLLQDADQVWSVNFRDNLLVAAVEKGGESSIEMLDFS